MSKRLTWEDLAKIYEEEFPGSKPRTLPMESVAIRLEDRGLIIVDSDDYYIRATQDNRKSNV